MTLIEFDKLLNKYKEENFTSQSWVMSDFKYKNEYIDIFRIDSSNWHGGETVVNGKQWGIMFRYGEKDFTQLKKWQDMILKIKDIRITPRRGSSDEYGIRFYNMSTNPDKNIIDAFIEYLFD
jgi:hypothetical protein